MRRPAGKRARLAAALDRFALLDAVERVRVAWQRDLTILAYHRVVDLGDEEGFPFDPELVSASPAQFREQMELVRASHDPIDFATLAAAAEGRAELPPRPLIVTFDDGYEDNYTHAMPILAELGIPATVFVSSGYVGSEETFWYDHLAYTIFRSEPGTLRLPGVGPVLEIGDVASRRRAARIAVRHLQRVRDADRRVALEEIRSLPAARIRDADRALSRPMNRAQLVALSDSGIEIGAHTVSHPSLCCCDPSALRSELVDSRRDLAAATGQPIVAMSYPFGGRDAFDDRVMDAAAAAGYRYAAGYLPGRNALGALDRFALRRLHVERYTSRLDLRSMLAAPQIFARA